jgi:predicted HicB family RNase H-like nuclease
MPRGKIKVKTAVITLRVEPQLKAAAQAAATKERRDLTNWIEGLILKGCEKQEMNTKPLPAGD